MTNDPFLVGLKQDWRAPPPDLERLGRAVRRRRSMSAFFEAMEVAGAFLALAFGLWFLVRARGEGDWSYGLAGAALLAATLLTILSMAQGRKDRITNASQTPFGVIIETRRQAQATIAAMRRMRWAAWLLLAAAVVGTAMIVGGLSDMVRLKSPIIAWIGTAGVLIIGTWLRQRRMERLCTRCNALLSDWREVEDG